MITGTVMIMLKIVLMTKMKMMAVMMAQKMMIFMAMTVGMMAANIMMKKFGGSFGNLLKGGSGGLGAQMTGYGGLAAGGGGGGGYGSGIGSLLGDMMMHHMNFHHSGLGGGGLGGYGADTMTVPMYAMPDTLMAPQRRVFVAGDGLYFAKPKKM